jgi:hypothetical protein
MLHPKVTIRTILLITAISAFSALIVSIVYNNRLVLHEYRTDMPLTSEDVRSLQLLEIRNRDLFRVNCVPGSKTLLVFSKAKEAKRAHEFLVRCSADFPVPIKIIPLEKIDSR